MGTHNNRFCGSRRFRRSCGRGNCLSTLWKWEGLQIIFKMVVWLLQRPFCGCEFATAPRDGSRNSKWQAPARGASGERASGSGLCCGAAPAAERVPASEVRFCTVAFCSGEARFPAWGLSPLIPDTLHHDPWGLSHALDPFDPAMPVSSLSSKVICLSC